MCFFEPVNSPTFFSELVLFLRFRGLHISCSLRSVYWTAKLILRPTVCTTRKGSVTSTQKLFIIQYWSSRFLSTPLPIFLSYSCPFSDNRVRIRRGVIYLGLVCVILILIKYFDCPYVVHWRPSIKDINIFKNLTICIL